MTKNSTTDYTAHRKLLQKEIRQLLYAFGDSAAPREDTVSCVEDLLLQYIIGTTQRAHDVAAAGHRRSMINSGQILIAGANTGAAVRVKTEDLLFVLRDDPKKLARAEELLFMNEELKKARRAFELEDQGMAFD